MPVCVYVGTCVQVHQHVWKPEVDICYPLCGLPPFLEAVSLSLEPTVQPSLGGQLVLPSCSASCVSAGVAGSYTPFQLFLPRFPGSKLEGQATHGAISPAHVVAF